MTRARFNDLFGIDYRALAVLRIGLGLFLLVDLIQRSFDLSAFYTDFGVLPRAILAAKQHIPGTITFHTWGGSAGFEGTLFVVAGALAVLVILGWYTRPALLLSWIFLISLQNRNEVIADGGDQLLRTLLFWSLFLPMGARYSLDAKRRGMVPAQKSHASMATLALLLQVVIIYEFAGFSKYDPIWYKEGTATFYVLASEQVTKPLGLALLHYPGFLKIITFATLLLEIIVPPLAFLPFRTRSIRLWIVALFWLFHLGLFFSLELGLFPFLCMLGWIPYLPDTLWDRLERWIPFTTVRDAARRSSQRDAGRVTGRAGYLPPVVTGSLVVILLLFTLVWNFKTFDEDMGRYIPTPVMVLARAFRLDQNWQLFSPRPPTDRGWHVFVGTLCNGSQTDLLKGSGPVSWDKPRLVSSIYRDFRWRKYFKLFLSQPFAENRLFYSQYLCRRWNQQHPQQPLKQLELWYLKSPLFVGKPAPPAERYLVFEYSCGECGPPDKE